MSRISKLVKEAQSYKGQEFRQPRMFVPSNMIIPQTAKDTMARQLYEAGVITKDDFEKMLGVVYDGNYADSTDAGQDYDIEDFDDEAFSTYDDEFKISSLAEYYDDYDTESAESGSTSVSGDESNAADIRADEQAGTETAETSS